MSGIKRASEDAPESESKRIADSGYITNHERRQELIAKLQYLQDSHKLIRSHYELSGCSYLIKEESSNLLKQADILFKLSKIPDNDEEPPKDTKSYIRSISQFTYNNGTPEINEVFERLYR